MLQFFPTVDEFKEALFSNPPEGVVRDYLFTGVPYAFSEQPELMDLLRSHICDLLPVKQDNIIVVGSGKIGFSLNPDNFFRKFSDVSDIDVIVVDERLFDQIWFALIKWHYPKRLANRHDPDRSWMHYRKDEIFWGGLKLEALQYEGLSFPDALKPIRNLATQWFNTFQSFSQYPEFVRRTVTGRLYRTWEHAMFYHVEGLRQVKESILSIRQGGNDAI